MEQSKFFSLFNLSGNTGIAFRWLLLTMIIWLWSNELLNSQTFTRVNSGTKSDIGQIKVTNDGSAFFLTDKIYTLEDDVWKKVDFPVAGKIAAFDAISRDDIWFSTTLEISTSLLYHYHNGITENIHSPFANSISAVSFESKNLGFFASYSDVVVYSNGGFGKVNPVTTRGFIFKSHGMSADKFWVLSQFNEFFIFEKGRYTRMFPDKTVVDFQFINSEHGFVLCDDAILEVDGMNVIHQYKNTLFKKARKIYVRDNEIWVIGDAGLILVQQSGLLRQVNFEGKENLIALEFGRNNDIWITGKDGLLLYSGSRKFRSYNERYPGFAAKKLIPFGIELDNEYGVALADFNGDGKTDIYTVCISDPDKLYINQINPKEELQSLALFVDEATKRGALRLPGHKVSVSPSELKLGVAVADIDNDGDEDIYLTSLNGKNKLLLNNGKGYFRSVSDQHHRASEDINRSNAAAFADVDLDGDPDLFVTSENGTNRLYLNDGNGYFTDVTDNTGLISTGGGMCASFSDVNEDGYPDLCVTFWYPSNKIYLNETKNGIVKFRDITANTDLARSEPAKSNGVVFADVNNDGHSDLFIANRHTSNKLYLNDGKGNFRDVTDVFFENKVFMTNGAVFADFDLDGYQDLYITNVGENVMYRNINGTRFEDVTGKFGTELSGYCTGCAAGDIDNDGDVDFYAANYINGSSMLFLNKMEKKNAVTFKISGTHSNRNAIGAKIFLYRANPGHSKDTLAGFREISGGGGYGSVSAKEAIFALTPGLDYYALVQFPASGKTVRVNKILAGSMIRVNEETGFAAFLTLSEKAVIRFFTDPEMQLEFVKYVAVLMILIIYLVIQHNATARIAAMRWMMCLALLLLFAVINQVFLFSSDPVLFFISPVIAIVGLVILHLITERIMLKRQSQREKMELREKISRDLHDDLASTLGSISIYSSTLKEMDSSSQVNFRKLSAKISELTQTALQSITDIIWMTSPRNDTLRSLLSKVSALMFDVLTDNGIRFDEKVELPEQQVILDEKLRHNTFLILKEALNNVIRHANARSVTLRAHQKDKTCFIQFADDGTGFDIHELKREGAHGNGLVNMRRRASESGIEFRIQTTIGLGSVIELSFKI